MLHYHKMYDLLEEVKVLLHADPATESSSGTSWILEAVS